MSTRLFADGRRAEDHVLQLAHIARPAVAEQGRKGAGRQAADRPLDLRAGLLHEVAGQQQDVLAAFAQRRLQVEHVEAVEQVFAKVPSLTIFSRLRWVALRIRTLTFTSRSPPTRRKLPSLKSAAAWPAGTATFPDFVEEHRALVGQFHQPEFAAALGAGEGAGA
jgi:hypothetical protein